MNVKKKRHFTFIVVIVVSWLAFAAESSASGGTRYVGGTIAAKGLVLDVNGKKIWAAYKDGDFDRVIRANDGSAFPEDSIVMSAKEYNECASIFLAILQEHGANMEVMSADAYRNRSFADVNGRLVTKPVLDSNSKSVVVRTSFLGADELVITESPIDLPNRTTLMPGTISVLLDRQGRVISQSPDQIGYLSGFYSENPNDPATVCTSSLKDYQKSHKLWAPMEGAVFWVTSSIDRASADSDGDFQISYKLTTCPGATIDQAVLVMAKLGYRIFDPQSTKSYLSYFLTRGFTDYCRGLGEGDLGVFQQGMVQAAGSVEAAQMTQGPRFIKFAVDIAILTGRGRFFNEGRSGIRLHNAGMIPLGDTTEYGYEDPSPHFPRTTPLNPDLDGDGTADTHGAPSSDGNVEVWLGPSPGIQNDQIQRDADLTRIGDFRPDIADQGLLDKIGEEDLEKTDILVFRMSDGALVFESEGLREDWVGPDDGGDALVSYRFSIRGPASFTIGSQATGNPDPVTVGERLTVVAVNRATGYVGTSEAMIKPDINSAGIISFTTEGDIRLRPPNLKITAKRKYEIEKGLTAGKEVEYLVGFEGSGLVSDQYIAITTEWNDWDGSPLPEDLPGYTGRLAVVVDADNLEPYASGETNSLAQFPINPGRHTVVVKCRGENVDDMHYYVHVNGKPTCENQDFSTDGAGNGKLQYRPKLYVPIRVPVFDEEATAIIRNTLYQALEQARTNLNTVVCNANSPSSALDNANQAHNLALAAYEGAETVYKWVYRPEFQFSLYDLNVTKINRVVETNTGQEERVNIFEDEIPVIFPSDREVEVQYTLYHDELGTLPSFGPNRELIFSLGAEEVAAVVNADNPDIPAKFDELGHLSLLETEDFVSLRLIQNGDDPNILWQFVVAGVDLDIDSDNTNGFCDPDLSGHEDKIEDITNRSERAEIEDTPGFAYPLGKVIEINKNDLDDDGVPDYADGFDMDVSDDRDNQSEDAQFVPVHLKLDVDENTDLSNFRFRFLYSASNPADMSMANDRYALPSQGALRLWKKNGDEVRNGEDAANSGDFVSSETLYSASQLGITDMSDPKTKLYLEAVGRGEIHEKITIEMLIYRNQAWEKTGEDTIIADITSVEFVECGEAPKKFPYKDILPVLAPRPIVKIHDDAVATPFGDTPNITVEGEVRSYLAPIDTVYVNGVELATDQGGLSPEEANGPDGVGPFTRLFSKAVTIGQNHVLGTVVQAVNVVENVGYDGIWFHPTRDPLLGVTAWEKRTMESIPADDDAAIPDTLADHTFKIEVISPLDDDILPVDNDGRYLEVKIKSGADERILKARRVNADENRFLTKPLRLIPQNLGTREITVPDVIEEVCVRVSRDFADKPEPEAEYRLELNSSDEFLAVDTSCVPVTRSLVGADILTENHGNAAQRRVRSPGRWLTKSDSIEIEIGNLEFNPETRDDILLKIHSESDPSSVHITLTEETNSGGYYLKQAGDNNCIKFTSADAGTPGQEIYVSEEELITQYLSLGPRNMGHVGLAGQELEMDDFHSYIGDIIVDKGEYAGGGIPIFYSANKMAHEPQIATSDRIRLQQNADSIGLWRLADYISPEPVGAAEPHNALELFIKSCGGLTDNEADFLHISAHGDYEGIIYDDSGGVIIKPNNRLVEGAIINQTDWNTDTEWVFLATCDQLNNSPARTAPDPTGAQNWQGALFGWPRHAHGILGSTLPMAGRIDTLINTFWDRLTAGATFIDAYISGCATVIHPGQPGGHAYAILCHFTAMDDTLKNMSVDRFNIGVIPSALYHVQTDEPLYQNQPHGILRGTEGNGAIELWCEEFSMPMEIANFPHLQTGNAVNFEGILMQGHQFVVRILLRNGTHLYIKHNYSSTAVSSLDETGAENLGLTLLTEELGIPLEHLLTMSVGNISTTVLTDNLDLIDQQTTGYEVVFSRVVDQIPAPDEFVRVQIMGDEISQVQTNWHDLTERSESVELSESKHPEQILRRNADVISQMTITDPETIFKVATCQIGYEDAGVWDVARDGELVPVCRILGSLTKGDNKTAYVKVLIDIDSEAVLYSNVENLREMDISLEKLINRQKGNDQ